MEVRPVGLDLPGDVIQERPGASAELGMIAVAEGGSVGHHHRSDPQRNALLVGHVKRLCIERAAAYGKLAWP